MRKTRTLLWALCLGLLLGAGYAAADTSADKKKAKPGEACKTGADCDQSGGSQTCDHNKCQRDKTPPPPLPPPPT